MQKYNRTGTKFVPSRQQNTPLCKGKFRHKRRECEHEPPQASREFPLGKGAKQASPLKERQRDLPLRGDSAVGGGEV